MTHLSKSQIKMMSCLESRGCWGIKTIYANKATVRALVRYGLVKVRNSQVRLTGLGDRVIQRYFDSKALASSSSL